MGNWPHAPTHWLFSPGTYMVTAATYRKENLFSSSDRLELLETKLFDVALEFEWHLEAWAILANHYHFVAKSPEDPSSLRRLVSKLHMTTSKELNVRDATPGRKVWHQYWESQITIERSYLARLAYVHANPVKHGIVKNATQYRFCSAAWFVNNAPRSFVETLRRMKTDQLKVPDNF